VGGRLLLNRVFSPKERRWMNVNVVYMWCVCEGCVVMCAVCSCLFLPWVNDGDVEGQCGCLRRSHGRCPPLPTANSCAIPTKAPFLFWRGGVHSNIKSIVSCMGDPTLALNE